MPRAFLLCNQRYKPKWRLALRHAVEEMEAESEVPQSELWPHSEDDMDLLEARRTLAELVPVAMSPRSDSSDCVVPQLTVDTCSSSGSMMESLLKQMRTSRKGAQHALVSDCDSVLHEKTDNSEGKSSEPDTSEEDERSELQVDNDIGTGDTSCAVSFESEEELEQQPREEKLTTCKKTRHCPHCDKGYVSLPALSMHIRTHGAGCQCPYCGKRFSRPWLLQGHIRTHTGEKPFTCPTCHKAFADKSNLRAHIQTHSQTKPFVCRRCSKAFALKSYLYKHEESSCLKK